MIRFLTWLRSILLSVVSGLAKTVVLAVLAIAVLVVISLARGDGLPGNMVIGLDLREPIDDSAASAGSFLAQRHVTVMDIVLGLDAAGRDRRVKGVVMRLGNGAISSAQGQEIAAAVQRFRAKGKFVIAQASAFFGAGLGDYLAASAANEIWVQPKSPFSVSGAGGGELFLRGTLDKIGAQPQIAKRAEYKSAADTFMEKQMSPADREQLMALMNSVYDSAVGEMAANRHLARGDVIAALQASPQFAEEARSRRLVDRIGYDDEARAAAKSRAGDGAKTVAFNDYVKNSMPSLNGANIALVEAEGEIRDGTNKSSWISAPSGIASDDLSAAIDQAARDKDIKAIMLRVDSPGGSVTASDQILHAVKAAQKAGKPVVVSMGGVAASGGYYISLSANKIVAEPGTITGSIGVLTGKVSFAKTLGLGGRQCRDRGGGKEHADGFAAAALHRRAMGQSQSPGRCDLRRFHPEGGGRPQAASGQGARRRPGPGLVRRRCQESGLGRCPGGLLGGRRPGGGSGGAPGRGHDVQGLSPPHRVVGSAGGAVGRHGCQPGDFGTFRIGAESSRDSGLAGPGFQPATGWPWGHDAAQSGASAAAVTAQSQIPQGNCLSPRALEL